MGMIPLLESITFSSQEWKTANVTKTTVALAQRKGLSWAQTVTSMSILGSFAGGEFQQATHGILKRSLICREEFVTSAQLQKPSRASTFRSVLPTGPTEALLTYSPAVCWPTASLYLSVSNLYLRRRCPTQPADRQRLLGNKTCSVMKLSN